MSFEDEQLLQKLSGNSYSYAEALTTVQVPVSAILLHRTVNEKYDTKLVTTRNGKSVYTHKAVILHSDPRCPKILKSIKSIGILDWQIDPLVQNYGIAMESIPTMTSYMQLPNGDYDCMLLTVTVLQRIIGQTYQDRKGEIFTPEPSEDGSQKIGDTRFYFDIDPVDAYKLPNYIQQMKVQAMTQAEAVANQRAVEENNRRQMAARTEIPMISISDEEIDARSKINKIKNTIAEHNRNLEDLKAKAEDKKLTEAKRNAAQAEYTAAIDTLKGYENELETATKALEELS